MKHTVTWSSLRYLSANAMPAPRPIWPPTMPWPPEEVALLVKHVHGTALALARSRLLAKHLGHDVLGVSPQHERVRMVAVGRDHPVGGPNGLTHAGKHRFLSNVQVAKTAEFLLNVELTAALFEFAHEVHLAKPARVRVFVQALFCLLGGGLLTRFCRLLGGCSGGGL